MICYCGRELGDVTEKTSGLCPDCGQSLWMQAARRQRPNSKAIAATLNQAAQQRCEHGNPSTCISRCGVVQGIDGVWKPIDLRERQAWFARVMGNK